MCVFPLSFQQVRKLLLELIYRMPVNDILRPYTETVLMLCMHLIESDNEENVLICLRIIIELNKHYRPAFTDVKPFVSISLSHEESSNFTLKFYKPFYLAPLSDFLTTFSIFD